MSRSVEEASGAGRPAGDERVLRLRLSAALAARHEKVLDDALRALSATSDPAAVEEALLQSYLFLGYPVALNAIARWRELSGRPAPAAAADDLDVWRRRGAEVCRRVYGGTYDELRENVRALHPDMERWMVAEGYGKVLGRPGLALVERELCVVALLAVLDVPRQLYSHLRGALSVGASAPEVEAALAEGIALAAPEAAAGARAVWERVRSRRPAGA